MNKNELTLKYSLIAGAIYFISISVVHLFGIKVPGLYIYYTIPSYQYQDQIISFLAFGWALFFYSASANRSVVPFVLLSCLVALSGLVNINLSNDFGLIAAGTTTTPFWIQTIVLFLYVVWLFVFYAKTRQKQPR